VTTGVLVVHGFTGSPASMAHVADGIAGAGFVVSVPRLPGHGTVVDDMLDTRWADWSAAAESAYGELAATFDRVAVVGQSMGGTLACRLAANHPAIAALVCINPMVLPRERDEVEFLEMLIEAGEVTVDGIGQDLADPDAVEPAYDRTPLRPLRSLLAAVEELQPDLPRIACPALILTSPEDHTVPPANSDHLAAIVAGPVERVSLDRSYHVASMDYDKDLIVERTVEFLHRVTP
jgi:carboxylesterase